jgi:hypothetical protein
LRLTQTLPQLWNFWHLRVQIPAYGFPQATFIARYSPMD